MGTLIVTPSSSARPSASQPLDDLSHLARFVLRGTEVPGTRKGAALDEQPFGKGQVTRKAVEHKLPRAY